MTKAGFFHGDSYKVLLRNREDIEAREDPD